MEHVKEAGRQIVAGGSAGMIICIMHPLDLAKTRLQLGAAHYSGIVDVFKKTYKLEGLTGFYKGVLPPILAETPKRAIKFLTFEQYNRIFSSDLMPNSTKYFVAGLCSGLTGAVFITPFELIKVRLQTDRSTLSETRPSTYELVRDTYRRHGIGLKGFYCGFPTMLYRDGVWNCLYFGIYHNLKVYVPDEKLNPAGNLAGRLFLGFCAGITLQTILLIRNEEGVKALYRGLTPKMLRLGPGGAMMAVVFENVYGWMRRHT